MDVCYRHRDRETGVACSSCGRPICPDCMTPTPVGMRCPECVGQRTRVQRPRAVVGGAPVATQALIVLNALVFLAETGSGASLGGGGGGSVFDNGALFGPLITGEHQYWRLLTAGFLHDGLLHIAFNMMFLFFIGRILEPVVGRANFIAIYFASLLAGSFGALLFAPDVPTVGASGACFGLLGALVVLARARRISIWQSGLGPTLLINVVFTLGIRGISIGAHIGGLLGGVICGVLVVELWERRRLPWLALGGCAALAMVSVVAAVAVAGGQGLLPQGLGFRI